MKPIENLTYYLLRLNSGYRTMIALCVASGIFIATAITMVAKDIVNSCTVTDLAIVSFYVVLIIIIQAIVTYILHIWMEVRYTKSELGYIYLPNSGKLINAISA